MEIQSAKAALTAAFDHLKREVSSVRMSGVCVQIKMDCNLPNFIGNIFKLVKWWSEDHPLIFWMLIRLLGIVLA